MKQIAFAIVVCTFAMAAASAGADDTHAALYAQMYGRAESMARQTRDFADDLELAGEILQATDRLADNASFAAYLCDKAAGLAMRRPEGVDVAVQAQRKRVKFDAAQADDALKQMIIARESAYRAARGDDRTVAGSALISELLLVAKQREQMADYTEAATLYRKASGLARALQSPQLDAINDQVDRVGDLAKAQRQVSILNDRLDRDKNDQSARRELAMVYLCELQDFAAAEKQAAQSGDDAIKRIAAISTKGIGDLTDAEAAALGDWCAENAAAPGASNVAKVNLLSRAKLSYERFLSVHTDGDVQRLRVSTVLERVKADLTAARPAKISTPASTATVATTARSVDPNAKVVKGRLYAAGDYFLTLRVNGQEVCSGGYSTLCAKDIELKDGDVITAKVDYYDEDFYDGTLGFWCMFVAENNDRRNSFMTSPRDWYCYTPLKADNWSHVDTAGRHPRAQVARPFPVKLSQVVRQAPGINSLDALRGGVLWGQARETDTYFYHVVEIR